MQRSDGRIERVCRECARRRVREFHQRHYVPHPRPPKKPPPPRPKRKPKPPPKGRQSRPAYLRVLDHSDIVEGGCWLWRGALNENGYGRIQLGRGKGTEGVHRVMYEHFVGALTPGLDVMHICHTPNCVNPAHLRQGTRAENMAMSKRDGRPLGPHGSLTRMNVVP